jgi:FKBP-type peptidyl-prolyl cis-trans isomerase
MVEKLKAEEMLRELKRQEELRAKVKIIDPVEEEAKKKKEEQIEKEKLEKEEQTKNKKNKLDQKDDVDVGESSQLGKVGGVLEREGWKKEILAPGDAKTYPKVGDTVTVHCKLDTLLSLYFKHSNHSLFTPTH